MKLWKLKSIMSITVFCLMFSGLAGVTMAEVAAEPAASSMVQKYMKGKKEILDLAKVVKTDVGVLAAQSGPIMADVTNTATDVKESVLDMVKPGVAHASETVSEVATKVKAAATDGADKATEAVEEASTSFGQKITNVGLAFNDSLKAGISSAAAMLGTTVDAVWSTWQGKTIVLLAAIHYMFGMAGFVFIGALFKSWFYASILTALWVWANKSLKERYTMYLTSNKNVPADASGANVNVEGDYDPWKYWAKGKGASFRMDTGGAHMLVWLILNAGFIFAVFSCF